MAVGAATQRVELRNEGRFGPVDVADTAHDRLIHQEITDAPLAAHDLSDHGARLRPASDRVGAEPGEDLAPHRGRIDGTGRRP